LTDALLKLCTLVVPTYNAADIIDATVARLRRFVLENPVWCVLFVCDGCSDGTPDRLRKLLAGDGGDLSAEIYDVNRGKGFALRRGLDKATTPLLFYTDVDLAYDPDQVLKLRPLLEAGADIAAANRAHPDSVFHISPRDFPRIYKRHVMSRMFNLWLRCVLPITLLDTQAGLKGVTAAAWRKLSPLMKTDGFFFDVELLARAGHLGMKTSECPITFTYVNPSTVRLMAHGTSMLGQSWRLRRELKRLAKAEQTLAAAAPSAAREHG